MNEEENKKYNQKNKVAENSATVSHENRLLYDPNNRRPGLSYEPNIDDEEENTDSSIEKEEDTELKEKNSNSEEQIETSENNEEITSQDTKQKSTNNQTSGESLVSGLASIPKKFLKRKTKIILILVVAIIFLVFGILLLTSIISTGLDQIEGDFDTKCDYNITRVDYTCNDFSDSVSIKDFVIGATYKYMIEAPVEEEDKVEDIEDPLVDNIENSDDENEETEDEDNETNNDVKNYFLDYGFDAASVKALMIAIKTTALSKGNYNSSTKKISIDCSMKYTSKDDISDELYSLLENNYDTIKEFLYISSSYHSTITSLTSASALALTDDEIKQFVKTESTSYREILRNIYGPFDEKDEDDENDDDEEKVEDEEETETEDATTKKTANDAQETIYIGDSRTKGMADAGLVNDNNSVYLVANGYCWFIYNTNYGSNCSVSYNSGTNDTSHLGAINLANQKMQDGVSYNIVIWLGVNDLTYQNSYFEVYKALAQGEWANHNIYIAQVGPVGPNYPYIADMNDRIEDFNNNMKSAIDSAGLNNLFYLDLGLSMDSINWEDNPDSEQIHYIPSDYKKIFDLMNEGLSTSGHNEKTLYKLGDYCTKIAADDCVGGNNITWWWPIGSNECNETSDGAFCSGAPVIVDFGDSIMGYRELTNAPHHGLDIRADRYYNIISPKDGVVIDVNNSYVGDGSLYEANNLCGNSVTVDYGDGITVYFCHIQQNTIIVQTGQNVKQGQKLAQVGSSGRSEGPHLHFEMHDDNGNILNPLDYLSADNPRGGRKICINNNCSGINGDVISFINSWEGNMKTCTSFDGLSGYPSIDIGDGAITLGPGLTNYAMNDNVINYINQNGWGKYFPNNTVTLGMCVPVDVFNKVQRFVIEDQFAKPIDDAANKYGITLTSFQRDAITVFNYNLGPGYTENLIAGYAQGGYEGLWNAMKDYVHATIDGVYQAWDGLKKRRKSEFALFVTGDYSLGATASHPLTNYDYYDSEGVMARKMVCAAGATNNYTKVTSNGLTDVLTGPLRDALEAKNTSVEEFNQYILDSVISYGVGTRDGVVAAAVALVGGLYEQYSIRIPYTYGGQHGGSIDNIRNPLSTTFYGVDPLWGSSINYYRKEVNRTYDHYGPDCSGFVMWALHNGGIKIKESFSTNIASVGQKISLSNSNNVRVGDPGDLMYRTGHIMLIVGVDDSAKLYYVAHASGGDDGVKISTVSFNNNIYSVVKLDSYYADNANIEYSDASAFTNAFKNGELD